MTLCVGPYKTLLFSGIRSGMLFETQEEVLLSELAILFLVYWVVLSQEYNG